MSTLTDEQRRLVGQAITSARAAAVLRVLESADVPSIMEALSTAMAAVVEVEHPPRERGAALTQAFLSHLCRWADVVVQEDATLAAAVAEAAGSTRQ